MTTYQEQIVDEKAELDGKLERLKAFLAEDPPDTVDDAERQRMDAERRRIMEQARVMADYSAILKARIAAFQ